MGNAISLSHFSQNKKNEVKLSEHAFTGKSGKRWNYGMAQNWWALSVVMYGMMMDHQPSNADSQEKMVQSNLNDKPYCCSLPRWRKNSDAAAPEPHTQAEEVLYESGTCDRNITLPVNHMLQDLKPSSSTDEGSSENSREDVNLQPEKKSLEDFNLLSVLGRGKFGKVFLAELGGTDELYALKMMKKHVIQEKNQMNYTVMERRVLALAGAHPYLTHLYCCFQNSDYLCFAMEFVNGGELFSHISRSGAFHESRARFYAAEIACALMFLHSKGIIHRDVKPENILLDAEGHCKLADFGLCKNIIDGKTTGSICGTPQYMAPEMIKTAENGTSLDWWALGVVLYEMLTGYLPFDADNRVMIFNAILNYQPTYSSLRNGKAASILKAFLKKNPKNRLGCVVADGMEIAVKNHPFFEEINWSLLEQKKVIPPFQPRIATKRDISNFEEEFTCEEPKLSLVNDHCLIHSHQDEFEGFSFINTKH